MTCILATKRKIQDNPETESIKTFYHKTTIANVENNTFLTTISSQIRLFCIALVLVATGNILYAAPPTENDTLSNVSSDSLPKYRIGGYGGLLLNSHSASFSTLPGFPACCPGYTGGSGIGWQAGALIEFPLTPLFSVEARLGLAQMGARLTAQENIGNFIVDDSVVTSVLTEHSIDASLLTATIDLLGSVRPTEGIVLSAGVRLGFPIQASFNQKEEIISPSGVTFQDGRRTRSEVNGESIPEAAPLLLQAVFGAGYEIPLTPTLTLTPEIQYHLGFNSISSAVSWTPSALALGAALRWSIFPAPPKTMLYDTTFVRDTLEKTVIGVREPKPPSLVERSETTEVVENDDSILHSTTIRESYLREVPVRPELRVEVRAVAQAEDGTTIEKPQIIVEEIESKESYPLLPYVFFDEGNADIAKSRLNLLSKDKTAAFDESSLPKNSVRVYYHLLNIVGKRLRDKPDSKVSLVGCVNPVEAGEKQAGLARRRAESVRAYLVDVWSIDPSRIAISERGLPSMPSNNTYKEGREENRRVEIITDEPLILEPINTKDIIRTINPAAITIEPDVEAEVGIERWALNIEIDGKSVETFTGLGVPDPRAWMLNVANFASSGAKVRVVLDVVDSAGQKGQAAAFIDVEHVTVRKKRAEMIKDGSLDKYSLILFDFDKATLSPAHKRSLEMIKGYIQEGAKVSIAGYTDVTGDANYNRELSLRRAEEVRKALGLPRAAAEGIGNTELLFGNDTPEGRFYCRTVVVTVENPAR